MILKTGDAVIVRLANMNQLGRIALSMALVVDMVTFGILKRFRGSDDRDLAAPKQIRALNAPVFADSRKWSRAAEREKVGEPGRSSVVFFLSLSFFLQFTRALRLLLP